MIEHEVYTNCFNGIYYQWFYFPFEFAFLPTEYKANACGIGLIFMVYHMVRMEKISISREVAIASVIAIVFSAIGLFSVDYNYSDDYSYATYIVSMWVWFSASYAVVTLMSFCMAICRIN